jgi:hypothetical protein
MGNVEVGNILWNECCLSFANVSEQERREKSPGKSKLMIFPPFPASPC